MKSWTYGDSIHRFATKEEAEKFERSCTLDRGRVREVDGEVTSLWLWGEGCRDIKSWGVADTRFKTRREASHWFCEGVRGYAEAPTHQLAWRGYGREPFGSAQGLMPYGRQLDRDLSTERLDCDIKVKLQAKSWVAGFHRFANQKDAETYTKAYTNELSGIQHSSLKPNSELEWTGSAFKVAPYSGDEVAPAATPPKAPIFEGPITWGTKDWRLGGSTGFIAETDARAYFRTLPDQYQRETDLRCFRDMDPTHILDQGEIHPILSWGYVSPVQSAYKGVLSSSLWFGTRAEAVRAGLGLLPSSSLMVPSFKEVATHEFVWEKSINGGIKKCCSWEHGCPPMGTYAQIAQIPESRRPLLKTSQDPKPSEATPSQESDGSQGLLWVMGAVLGVSALVNKTRRELPSSSPHKDEPALDLTQGEEMPIHEALKSSC